MTNNNDYLLKKLVLFIINFLIESINYNQIDIMLNYAEKKLIQNKSPVGNNYMQDPSSRN